MAIRFCIFDVGQVCYPYSLEPLDCFLRDRLNARHSVKSFDYKPFMKGKVDFTQFCKDLCSHCGVDYSKDVEALVDEAMHQGVGEFFAETLSVMAELYEKDIGICLLSNALPNLFDTAKGLVTEDKVFVSYELGLLKPDEAIYKKVLEKLGARSEEVVFVDDKLKNVEAAKSLGIKGIVFNKYTIREDIKQFVNC